MGCASTRVAVAVVGDVTQHKKVNDLKILARLSGNKEGTDEETDMDIVKADLAGTTGQPSNRFEVLHGLQPDQLLVVIKGDNVDSSLREMAQKKYIKMLASQMKGMAKKGELKLSDGREIASVVIEGEEGVGASIPTDPK
ncbi:PREDICTED: uncharacterized protein LOC109474621 [Branchiostoma belcheri]|uniref:Uncharacterized protein LOC109474621 n=1 Tax=Branchiostoma belcheri TaxID=7741 RepID=A0A6P4ZLN3_BRABE|nr:PREDICTED: uncharacterized protein LOC109474621 [Branchiostoma belcheri]